MSRMQLTKIATPATPAANQGQVYYDSRATNPGLAWIDETGNVANLVQPSSKLTADTAATTSTTLANVTGLALSVKSGLYYRLEFGVVWTTATATTGLKVGLTTPTFTIFAATVSGQVAADGTAAEWTGALTTSGDSTSLSGAEATATTYLAVIRGMILPSADGVVQVQYAAEVAAAGHVVVKQGSYGLLTPLF